MHVRRGYVTLGNGCQVHYRRAGQGCPLLMLHPSPLCSAFLEPLMQELASEFDVVAMDTPGYGNSDPLATPDESLVPYVEVIAEVLDLLELQRPLLYGNATGAQLAIESARAFPGRLAGLVLENAAAFTDDERDTIQQGYFPDLSPTEDGEHLQLAWIMARQTFQFFPWYDTSDSARVAAAAPPDAVAQAVALAYLRAGPDYPRAYRAAFANERPENLAAVKLPTTVLLWSDSVLLTYSERLRAAPMPDNIRFRAVSSGVEARFSAVREALCEQRDGL